MARKLLSGIWLFVLFAVAGCRGDAVARSTAHWPDGAGFVRREFPLDGKMQTLWVFLPKDYSPDRQYPAIVFLHGLFEAGDGEACLSGGLGPVIAQQPDNWPFVTIFPQSTGTWRGEDREALVIAALDYSQREFSIDADRVILAGLSYGALGTWQIGANHPDRFAALVPVSGHRATELVERLALLPVWAFDMQGDPIVSSQSSEDMVRAISERGGVARLTEFLGVGHDCWAQAVHQSELVDWMLEQRRRPENTVVTTTDEQLADLDMSE